MGSRGANYEVYNEDILAKLAEWQSLCSFRVKEAQHDTIAIEFETLPADIDTFVRDLYEFCPDLVDQGTGCVAEMVEMMEETGIEISPKMKELIEGVDFEDEDYGLEILKREIVRNKGVTLWWD